MADPAPGFVARLGALVVSPRRLARRDLVRRDGKAGDDLFVVAAAAILASGGPALVHLARAIGGHRAYTAARALAELLNTGVPIFAVWVVASLLFRLFTIGSRGRAVSELGARVTEGYVLASLVTYVVVAAVPAGVLTYVLLYVPWLATALLFGLLLREALEPLPGATKDDAAAEAGDAEAVVPALGGRVPGFVLLAVTVLAGALLLRAGLRGADAPPIAAVSGKPAPPIALPLLGGGELRTASLGGRAVVLVFWATWCGPCMEELPALERLYRARDAAAPLVYAVDLDDAGPDRERQVRAVVSRLGLTMPIALDDGSAGPAYAIGVIPSAARLAPDGRLADLHEGALDEAGLRDLLAP